jgi:phage terminase large subunit-like protein
MTLDEILASMRRDKAVRRAIVRRSFKLFFLYYFGDSLDFPVAPFHEEWFDMIQNDTHSMWVISAFRNSGKSTIFTMAHVIWLIINGRAKYILLISETAYKAQTFLGHVRAQFEDNARLKADLGPFREENAGWNSISLVVKNYSAKISAVSIEQSVRGLRHLNHRPDLFLLDDCENQETVRTQENRDKLSQFLSGDVIPAGHSSTRTIVIGSILHADSLIPRLQKQIDAGKIDGIYRMDPIVDDEGNPAWSDKFPNAAAIEREKSRGISDREWSTEYLLRPIVDEDVIIKPGYINYYDREPDPLERRYRYVATGVDLAISQSSTADFTAMVSGKVTHEEDGEWRLFILPYPVNERLSGAQIIERISDLSLRLGNGDPTIMYIENVAFQQAMIDLVRAKGIPAEGVSPGGNDKRARVISISEITKVRVFFPRKGAERLIIQLTGFGAGEKYDDLVDAFVNLVLKIAERERATMTVPRILTQLAPQHTQQELERQADEEIIRLQELARGNKYWALVDFKKLRESQQRARENTNQESQEAFRKMSRRY